MSVVLVGPPGAGKSSVGRLLASRLGVPFADTDDLVAHEAGKPVGDIFIEDGEDVFRELEQSATDEAIATRRGVLALGSGSVLSPGTRDLLRGQRVVYLETAFPAVAKRSGLDGPHPPIPGNPRGRLRQMLEERRPIYADLAWLTVTTDDRDPEQVAGEIAAAIDRSRAAHSGEPRP
jgi:shikimate kinase